MNFDQVKDKFGTWADFFRPFIESEEFDAIFKKVSYDARRGKIICPASRDTFRCFRDTDYRGLRAVLLLQDPYPWVLDDVMVADGLAMSCRNTGSLQPSLDLFYGAIEAEFGQKGRRVPDLGYLASQGVLLLNTALTVEKGKVGSHQELWKPFTKFFFEQLNYYQRGLPIVFMGKVAQAFEPCVAPFTHWTKSVSHPAAAAHRGTSWDSEGMFGWINTILRQNNGEEFEINWLNIQNEENGTNDTSCTEEDQYSDY